jgi:hypothetical protein
MRVPDFRTFNGCFQQFRGGHDAALHQISQCKRVE